MACRATFKPITVQHSELTHNLVPGLYNPWWNERLLMAKQEIVELIPAKTNFILVDQENLGIQSLESRQAIPFLEQDGRYWGAPSDDHTAINELERLRKALGTNFIVFGWPAFWWLDHYAKFHRYLHEKYQCVLKNSRLIAFYLQS